MENKTLKSNPYEFKRDLLKRRENLYLVLDSLLETVEEQVYDLEDRKALNEALELVSSVLLRTKKSLLDVENRFY